MMTDRPADALQRDSLLATKLHSPPARAQLVSRPRLVERLNEGMRCKLTLVSAPAGFGKTTLLGEWCAICLERMLPIAWVSLDKGDNDPARFWAYVIAALEKIAPGVGEAAPALLHPAQPAPFEAMLTTLINAITATASDFALALDDFHVIDSQAIADGLAYLLDNLPPQMHLFIASRADPILPLPRLRARGQLNELRAIDLRFTPGEAATFLGEVAGLRLSPGEVAALESRTEGWIAGLQLAALSMRGREDIAGFISTFTGGHRFISEYLFTEVLNKQPGEVQSFLLHTSILERLAGSLCDAITERDDGQHMLDTLEHANLFLVPLDDEERWYRYHQLFSDFLRSRLQRTRPDLLPVLHHRASVWFERNGLVAEAIDHTFASGDFERATDLLERAADDFTKRMEQKTLLNWLEVLPATQMRSHPRLCLAHAWALLAMGQADAAEKRLRETEGLLEHSSEVAAIRATIASMRGNVERITEHSAHALEQIPANNLGLRGILALNQGTVQALSGDTQAAMQAFAEARSLNLAADNAYVALVATCQAAAIDMVQGKLHQATGTYRQALQLAATQPGQLDTGLAHLGIGGILLEQDKLEDAARSILEGIEQGQKSGNIGILLFGYTMLAQLKQAQGDADGALQCIQQVEQSVQSHTFPQFLLASIANVISRIYIVRGDITSAARWAEASRVDMHTEPSTLHMFEYLTSARLLLVRDEFDEALALLDRLQQFAQAEAYTGILINTLVLQAAVLEARGHTTQATATLAQALSLAEPEDYVRTFVDEGAPMADLLVKTLKAKQKGRLASYNFTTNYVGKLLAAFRSNAAGTDPASTIRKTQGAFQPLLNPLSGRELEVLRLIANGQSNQEIMQKLIVEKNTLKTHIRHLYRKLNARSRTQAIARARELNLL